MIPNMKNKPFFASSSLLLLLWMLLSSFFSSSSSAGGLVGVQAKATQLQPTSLNNNLRSSTTSATSRSLSLPLAVYTMPPFRVSFASPNTSSSTTSLLTSMKSALKLITSEFVLESFRIQIANLDDDLVDILHNLVRELITVKFSVSVRVLRDEQQQQQDPSNISINQQQGFTADFIGTASFREPNDVRNKPTNTQVFNLLGDWIEWAFQQDLNVYRQYLEDSTDPLLQHLTMLQVVTDIDPSSTTDEGGQGREPVPSSSENDESTAANETSLTVALVLVTILTGAAVFCVILPWLRRRRRRCYSYGGTATAHHRRPSLSPGSFFKDQNSCCILDADTVLPGRRADGQDETESPAEDDDDDDMIPSSTTDNNKSTAAALQAIEATDRYLSKHRPDLFRAVQRAASVSPPRRGGRNVNSAFFPADELREDGDDGEHQIGLDLGYYDDYIDDDGYYDDVVLADPNSTGYVPASSWWNKLTSSLQAGTDMTIHFSSRSGNRDGILVCDEDPSQYNFPFSDFPRTDGTPCLIYDESSGGAPGGSGADEAPPTTTVLLNEEFQQQLAMLGQPSNSLVEEGNGGENKVTDYDDDGGDHAVTTGPQFTERLERLVAMRRRHYEKERRMERAKQARRLAEEQEAAQRRLAEEREAQRQREMQLRQHEMELDIEEIEASFSPTATAVRRKGQLGKNTDNSLRADQPRHHKGHRVTVSDLDVIPLGAEGGEEDSEVVIDATLSGEEGSLPPIPLPPALRSSRPPLSSSDDCGSGRTSRMHSTTATASTSDGGGSLREQTQANSNRPVPVPKKNRRGSYRRSFSHGTNLAGMDEEKKVCDESISGDGHNPPSIKRQGSFTNADDVMTFGIAAYTKFV